MKRSSSEGSVNDEIGGLNSRYRSHSGESGPSSPKIVTSSDNEGKKLAQ